MDDLISRQAAIELAMQYCPDDDGSCSKAGEDIRNLLDELENLPSAEPERMCHGCRYEKRGSVVCDDCSRFFLDRYEVDNNGRFNQQTGGN